MCSAVMSAHSDLLCCLCMFVAFSRNIVIGQIDHVIFIGTMGRDDWQALRARSKVMTRPSVWLWGPCHKRVLCIEAFSCRPLVSTGRRVPQCAAAAARGALLGSFSLHDHPAGGGRGGGRRAQRQPSPPARTCKLHTSLVHLALEDFLLCFVPALATTLLSTASR